MESESIDVKLSNLNINEVSEINNKKNSNGKWKSRSKLKSTDYESDGELSDITLEFQSLVSKLKPGELVKSKAFGLFDAVNALQITDTKMDTGMLPCPEKFLYSAYKSPEQVLNHINILFQYESSWLQGHSLLQTLFCSRYLMHLLLQYQNSSTVSSCNFISTTITNDNDNDNDNKENNEYLHLVLRAYILSLLMSVTIYRRLFLNESAIGFTHEDEDMNSSACSLFLFEHPVDKNPIDQIMNILQKAIDYVENDNNTKKDNVKNNILNHLQFRYNSLKFLASLNKLSDFQNEISLSINNLNFIFNHDLELNIDQQDNDFSIYSQRILETRAPFRDPIPLSGLKKSIEIITQFFKDLLRIAKISLELKNLKTPLPIFFLLKFTLSEFSIATETFTHIPRSPLIKPVLHINITTALSAFGDLCDVSRDTESAVFLGEESFANNNINTKNTQNDNKNNNNNDNLLLKTILQNDPNCLKKFKYILSSKVNKESKKLDLMATSFQERLVMCFENLISTLFHNRCIQRENVGHCIIDWDSLHAEENTFEYDFLMKELNGSNNPQNSPVSQSVLCLSNYILFRKTGLMAQTLITGFELELYDSWEYSALYRYAAYLDRQRTECVNNIKLVLNYKLYDKVALAQLKSGNNFDTNSFFYKYSKALIDYHIKESTLYYNLDILYAQLCEMFETLNLIKDKPKLEFTNLDLVYGLRMKPFLSVGMPPLPPLDTLKNAYKNDLNEGEEGLGKRIVEKLDLETRFKLIDNKAIECQQSLKSFKKETVSLFGLIGYKSDCEMLGFNDLIYNSLFHSIITAQVASKTLQTFIKEKLVGVEIKSPKVKMEIRTKGVHPYYRGFNLSKL